MRVTTARGKTCSYFPDFQAAPACTGRSSRRTPLRVFFRDVHSDVLTASGPWRSSGDWWREDGWQHDEWDLEIHLSPSFSSASTERMGNSRPQQEGEQKQAVYRFYYDSIRQSWFVRGVYD
jgi:hypothetical protein